MIGQTVNKTGVKFFFERFINTQPEKVQNTLNGLFFWATDKTQTVTENFVESTLTTLVRAKQLIAPVSYGPATQAFRNVLSSPQTTILRTCFEQLAQLPEGVEYMQNSGATEVQLAASKALASNVVDLIYWYVPAPKIVEAAHMFFAIYELPEGLKGPLLTLIKNQAEAIKASLDPAKSNPLRTHLITFLQPIMLHIQRNNVHLDAEQDAIAPECYNITCLIDDLVKFCGTAQDQLIKGEEKSKIGALFLYFLGVDRQSWIDEVRQWPVGEELSAALEHFAMQVVPTYIEENSVLLQTAKGMRAEYKKRLTACLNGNEALTEQYVAGCGVVAEQATSWLQRLFLGLGPEQPSQAMPYSKLLVHSVLFQFLVHALEKAHAEEKDGGITHFFSDVGDALNALINDHSTDIVAVLDDTTQEREEKIKQLTTFFQPLARILNKLIGDDKDAIVQVPLSKLLKTERSSVEILQEVLAGIAVDISRSRENRAANKEALNGIKAKDGMGFGDLIAQQVTGMIEQLPSLANAPSIFNFILAATRQSPSKEAATLLGLLRAEGTQEAFADQIAVFVANHSALFENLRPLLASYLETLMFAKLTPLVTNINLPTQNAQTPAYKLRKPAQDRSSADEVNALKQKKTLETELKDARKKLKNLAPAQRQEAMDNINRIKASIEAQESILEQARKPRVDRLVDKIMKLVELGKNDELPVPEALRGPLLEVIRVKGKTGLRKVIKQLLSQNNLEGVLATAFAEFNHKYYHPTGSEPKAPSKAPNFVERNIAFARQVHDAYYRRATAPVEESVDLEETCNQHASPTARSVPNAIVNAAFGLQQAKDLGSSVMTQVFQNPLTQVFSLRNILETCLTVDKEPATTQAPTLEDLIAQEIAALETDEKAQQKYRKEGVEAASHIYMTELISYARAAHEAVNNFLSALGDQLHPSVKMTIACAFDNIVVDTIVIVAGWLGVPLLVALEYLISLYHSWRDQLPAATVQVDSIENLADTILNTINIQLDEALRKTKGTDVDEAEGDREEALDETSMELALQPDEPTSGFSIGGALSWAVSTGVGLGTSMTIGAAAYASGLNQENTLKERIAAAKKGLEDTQDALGFCEVFDDISQEGVKFLIPVLLEQGQLPSILATPLKAVMETSATYVTSFVSAYLWTVFRNIVAEMKKREIQEINILSMTEFLFQFVDEEIAKNLAAGLTEQVTAQKSAEALLMLVAPNGIADMGISPGGILGNYLWPPICEALPSMVTEYMDDLFRNIQRGTNVAKEETTIQKMTVVAADIMCNHLSEEDVAGIGGKALNILKLKSERIQHLQTIVGQQYAILCRYLNEKNAQNYRKELLELLTSILLGVYDSAAKKREAEEASYTATNLMNNLEAMLDKNTHLIEKFLAEPLEEATQAKKAEDLKMKEMGKRFFALLRHQKTVMTKVRKKIETNTTQPKQVAAEHPLRKSKQIHLQLAMHQQWQNLKDLKPNLQSCLDSQNKIKADTVPSIPEYVSAAEEITLAVEGQCGQGMTLTPDQKKQLQEVKVLLERIKGAVKDVPDFNFTVKQLLTDLPQKLATILEPKTL